MDFEEWEKSVPQTLTRDSLWKMKAYRLALYLSDLSWEDMEVLLKDRRTMEVADQLYRAVGSMSSNLAEGYSRSTGKDRALFYQYAFGSARESRDWYFKAPFVLGEVTVQQRIQILIDIIRLLATMISQQRGYLVREDACSYDLV